MPESLSYI